MRNMFLNVFFSDTFNPVNYVTPK